MNIYVIQDKVSKQCSPLFLAKNDETAIREFALFLKPMTISYADFNLYLVGCFDNDNAVITDNGVINGSPPTNILVYTGREVEEEQLQKLKVEE